MNLFGKNESKSLSEMEDEIEHGNKRIEIARQNLMLRELQQRGANWENFSTNGKKSGINFARVKTFLENLGKSY